MRDASLRVGRGEIVGLLGPSGVGQVHVPATAIGLINPPTSGRIAIGGSPVLDGPRALVDLRRFRREHLGFVFQKSNLIPFLTALENVQIAVASERRAAAPGPPPRAWSCWSTSASASAPTTCPTPLSGGEQQRVAVARALANQPSLILADEPTAALDSERGRQVMELFARSRPRTRTPASSS